LRFSRQRVWKAQYHAIWHRAVSWRISHVLLLRWRRKFLRNVCPYPANYTTPLIVSKGPTGFDLFKTGSECELSWSMSWTSDLLTNWKMINRSRKAPISRRYFVKLLPWWAKPRPGYKPGRRCRPKRMQCTTARRPKITVDSDDASETATGQTERLMDRTILSVPLLSAIPL